MDRRTPIKSGDCSYKQVRIDDAKRKGESQKSRTTDVAASLPELYLFMYKCNKYFLLHPGSKIIIHNFSEKGMPNLKYMSTFMNKMVGRLQWKRRPFSPSNLPQLNFRAFQLIPLPILAPVNTEVAK